MKYDVTIYPPNIYNPKQRKISPFKAISPAGNLKDPTFKGSNPTTYLPADDNLQYLIAVHSWGLIIFLIISPIDATLTG